jgi:Cytidylate kinase-like family
VAARLGYRFVDDEVIEQAGEWVELAPEFVADVERRRSLMDRVLGHIVDPAAAPRVPTRPEGRALLGEGRVLPGDPELRTLIKQVLASLADSGSVVIASHAASFALSGRDVLRVLVTGSAETRANRLSAARGIDQRAAERLVKREDAGRAEYLKRFYGVERERPTHFDVVVNTDNLTPEQATEVIVAAAG